MPFKSEKQRRFLWLKHPDIAKRWAKEYPGQKDLPMYADKKEPEEKTSVAAFLNPLLQNYLENYKNSQIGAGNLGNMKESDSKQEYVKLPKTTGPTFAGQIEAQAVDKPVEDGLNDKSEPSPEKKDEMSADELFKKLSVVLSPKLMQEIEDEQAAQQARAAQRMPQNVGVKRLPPAVNSIMPPMGMAQAAPNPGQTQPAQPQQPAQPANGQLASVGGGASPNANPINSFGGLSSTGDINGNAALGTQNMAGGEKLAAGNPTLSVLLNMDYTGAPDPEDLDYEEYMTEKFSAVGLWDRIRAKRERGGKPAKPGDKAYPDAKSWKKVTAISEKKSAHDEFRAVLLELAYKYAAQKCSCGCGDTPATCKCPASCSCKKKGGSCYKPEKTAASSPAWQRSAGKNEEGGLNAKGRASYNKSTGGHLKAPVTESKPTGERAKRRSSFCSRMCGMKKHETGSKTKSDPDSRINKALRKWNCKCSSEKMAGLDRMLASALVSTAGGLALGAYPGLKLQQLSAKAGNPEFVNSFAGRMPIALGGALSGGLYNYLVDRADAEAEAKKRHQPAALSPAV